MPFQINFDVLRVICEEVYHIADKRDLAALCLVSKQANLAATAWLYRSIVFEFSNTESAATRSLINLLTSSRSGHRRFVNDVTLIKGPRRRQCLPSVCESEMLDKGALNELLPLLSNVQSYRWKIPNVNRHHLPSLLGIDPDIECTEVLFPRLQSRKRLDLPYYSSWDVDSFFDGSSTHYEQEACTPIRYTLLKPASTTPGALRTQSLSLSFEGSGQFELLAKRTIPKEYPLTNSLSTLQNLTLQGFDFSPPCGDHEPYIYIPGVQALELINCSGLGYLFNKMLLDYKEYNLKTFKIRQVALKDQDPGYFGKEKLEQLLILLNTGLEELTFANLGANRPSILAISAQGLTLRKLVMHETQNQSSWVKKTTLSAADIRLLVERCLRLENLTVDLGPKQLTRSSATADLLRQFERITHLEITLTPRDQSIIQDRTSALAIFTYVASPRLRRLDIYSATSYTESKAQPCTPEGDVQRHWCIDRVGKDVVAVVATCL